MELAAECCREILHHVNQAVRDMEDLLVSQGVARLARGVVGKCMRLAQRSGSGSRLALVSSSHDGLRSDI